MYRALSRGIYIIEYTAFSSPYPPISRPPIGRLWDFPSQNRTADSESPLDSKHGAAGKGRMNIDPSIALVVILFLLRRETHWPRRELRQPERESSAHCPL